MESVLAEVKNEYKGKAAILNHDVYKYKSEAEKYKVRVVPTIVFLDKGGNVYLRHEGTLSKEQIESIFKNMGDK